MLFRSYADILTPNLTEACIITDEPYRPDYSNDELKKIAMKLVAMGPSKIVITGIQRGHYITILDGSAIILVITVTKRTGKTILLRL